MTNKIKFSVVNNRIPSKEKTYYLAQLEQFCSFFNAEKVKYIQFGRQDIRGTPSITFIYPNSTADGLKYFSTFKELLAYVEGFNVAYNKENLKYTMLKELI